MRLLQLKLSLRRKYAFRGSERRVCLVLLSLDFFFLLLLFALYFLMSFAAFRGLGFGVLLLRRDGLSWSERLCCSLFAGLSLFPLLHSVLWQWRSRCLPYLEPSIQLQSRTGLERVVWSLHASSVVGSILFVR